MTVAERLELAPIEFPVEVGADARRRLLMPLRHSAWSQPTRQGAEYRRWLTRDQPLYFALTYLSHALRDSATGTYSFSRLHMDAAYRARRWIDRAYQERVITLAFREAAKSTWYFLNLPAWGVAHGHCPFFAAFSWNQEQANGKLTRLKRQLETNELLLADFPELTLRAKAASRFTTRSGVQVAAYSVKATTLGEVADVDRPRWMVGDDIEPGEDSYSPRIKEQALIRLRQNILPMNSRAVVNIVGTVTAPNSVMHDAARCAQGKGRAPWIAEEGFECRRWLPILDEGTDRERSSWPQRWPLEKLQAMRGTRTYALNYLNDPDAADSVGYWDRELFRYDSTIRCVRRVLYIDPATSTKVRANRKTDDTAVILAGIDAAGRRVCVESARAGRFPGHELRELIWRVHERYPNMRQVYVEDNKVGDRWETDILTPLPPGVRLIQDTARGAKKRRIEQALGHYQRGAVWHATALRELEDQALGWTPKRDGPGVDDLVDALAGALRVLFAGVPAAR